MARNRFALRLRRVLSSPRVFERREAGSIKTSDPTHKSGHRAPEVPRLTQKESAEFLGQLANELDEDEIIRTLADLRFPKDSAEYRAFVRSESVPSITLVEREALMRRRQLLDLVDFLESVARRNQRFLLGDSQTGRLDGELADEVQKTARTALKNIEARRFETALDVYELFGLMALAHEPDPHDFFTLFAEGVRKQRAREAPRKTRVERKQRCREEATRLLDAGKKKAVVVRQLALEFGVHQRTVRYWLSDMRESPKKRAPLGA